MSTATTRYQIVRAVKGESLTSEVFSADEFQAAFEARGFKPNGDAGHSRLREELRGQPCFSGLNGPMWGGTQDGAPVVRYECPEAYERLSA